MSSNALTVPTSTELIAEDGFSGSANRPKTYHPKQFLFAIGSHEPPEIP